MADPKQIIAVLRTVEAELQRIEPRLMESVQQAEQHIARVTQALDQRQADLEHELSSTKAALATAQNTLIEDQDGNRIEPDCSAQKQAVAQAEVRLAELRNVYDQFSTSAERFQVRASGLLHDVERHIPAATYYLREREAALQAFERPSGELPTSSPDTSKRAAPPITTDRPHSGLSASDRAAITDTSLFLVNTLTSLFGGNHGSGYQKAHQIFLGSLVDNANQPSEVRGWIRQELNRLAQFQAAQAAGRLPPGGNKSRIRNPPGMDVGHRIAGLDSPENFRLEMASMNRARPGIARRLGLPDWLR